MQQRLMRRLRPGTIRLGIRENFGVVRALARMSPQYCFTLASSFVRLSLGKALLATLLWMLVLRVSNAEIIQTTSSGGYQSDDGRTKIILSHRQDALGIFVAHFNEAIPLQEFNPEKLPTQGVSHLFIKFDPASEHQYSEIVIGEKTYPVAGNLNIWLTQNGSVSVNIDNMNPYITITHRNEKGDSLIGFYGMTEIVRGSGNLAAILAANQLSPEIAKIVKPYVADSDGLKFNGKQVSTPSVGIFVNRQHECISSPKSVSILTLEQLKAVQAVKGTSQQSKLLERYLKDNRATSPIAGHLILRVEQAMILLNLATKNIFDLRLIKNSISKRKICVISPID